VVIKLVAAINSRRAVMAKGKKYASITWGDLQQFIAELRVAHDLDVRFEVDYTACQGKFFRATVKLYEGREALEGLACIKSACGPFAADGDGQASSVMYLVNNAYIQYQGDPWNWTKRDRVKEGAGITEV
jgi:hypothetical protein